MFDTFRLLSPPVVSMSWVTDVSLPDQPTVRVRPRVPTTLGMALCPIELTMIGEWRGRFWDGLGPSSLYCLPEVCGAPVSVVIANLKVVWQFLEFPQYPLTDGFRLASAFGAPSSVLVGVAPQDALNVLAVIALMKAWLWAKVYSKATRDDPESHMSLWLAVARDVLGPLSRTFWRRHDNLAIAMGTFLHALKVPCPSALVEYGKHIARAAAQGYEDMPPDSPSSAFYAVPPSRPCHVCAFDGVNCLVTGWRARCRRCEASGWSCSFAAVSSVSCLLLNRILTLSRRCRTWTPRSPT